MIRAFRAIVERVRDHGPIDLVTAVLARASTTILAGAHRRRAQPSLNDLYAVAEHVHIDARKLIATHFSGTDSPDRLVAEAAEAEAALARRYEAADLAYPADWSVGQGTSQVLYAMVRARRPALIVETGVANGHSSYLMLRALERNGSGRLISIDLDARAGVLVDSSLRAAWDLRILPETGRGAAFRGLMRQLGAIDVFIHDSDHQYQWQRLELATAAGSVRSGGVVASDDVDASFAFVDVARERGWRPTLLVERRKVFGFAIVP